MTKCKITAINGQDIVFRLLSAEECDRLYHSLSLSDNPLIEEQVFNYITEEKYCVDGKIELDAGVVPTVVYAAIKLSGVLKTKFTLIDKIEEQRETSSKNAYYQIYAMISSIFPGKYTFEELKSKSLNELVELIVFCEMVVGKAIIDTKKQREAMGREEATSSGKRLINTITKTELDALRAAIQRSESEMI